MKELHNMPRDFTFEMYKKLLKTISETDYETITVRDYLSRDNLPEQFIINRHDIDIEPKNVLEMARMENDYEISSTYYFRTIDETFKPELIKKVESLGHEIGYHYEDLDKAEGNIKKAHNLFEKELEKLREVVNVETVCMHGNPLTDYDNRDMWRQNSFEKYDLLGEPYLSIDYTKMKYYSDTGRTWNDGKFKIKDQLITETDEKIQISSTEELIDLILSERLDQMCILSHPGRWGVNGKDWFIKLIKDLVRNFGKRVIILKERNS